MNYSTSLQVAVISLHTALQIWEETFGEAVDGVQSLPADRRPADAFITNAERLPRMKALSQRLQAEGLITLPKYGS